MSQSIYFPESLLTQLKELAESNHRSISSTIRIMLIEHLNQESKQ